MEYEVFEDQAMSLLQHYGYHPTETGLKAIWDKYMEAKKDLIEIFSKHPNWVPEKNYIQFSADYTRPIDIAAIRNFVRWCDTKAEYNMLQNAKEVEFVDAKGINDALLAFNNIVALVSRINSYDLNIDGEPVKATVNGKTADELRAITDTLLKKKRELTANYTMVRGKYVLNDELDKMRAFSDVMHQMLAFIENESSYMADEEFAGIVNQAFPNVKAVSGQKLSRIVLRLAKEIKLDTYKEMAFIQRNGEAVMKDFGWNQQFAVFGDSINPLKIKRHTIISLNPIDYWTMSFGHGWASCHTIDKNNIRNNGNDNYQGCYSGGTESYMLDQATLIFYTVDEDYDGDTFELEDKMNRCTFHVSKNGNVLIQGRVYPDGRDGGDQGLSAQFRHVMQKVLSDCLGATNNWTVKKGSANIKDYERSHGPHYKDYECYQDCTVSLRKDAPTEILEIGARIICPSCGDIHDTEECIECADCYETDGYVCDRCGYRFSEDNYEAIHIDEDYNYCCCDCARRDGFEWSSWNDCWVNTYDSDVHFDNNVDTYFIEGCDSVQTENCEWFVTDESARDAGYVYCVNVDEWYREEDARVDAYTGEYFDENGETIEIEGEYYMNAENAISAGYVFDNETKEWRREDEAA